MSQHDQHSHKGPRDHTPTHPTGTHTSHGNAAHFDLAGAALDEMHAAGFKPEFGSGVAEQVAEIRERLTERKPETGVEDLRTLGWSSIDNDTSRDLDQVEVAERVPGGIRLHVAIGDVAAAVPKGSPIDKHAEAQTQTIYTAVRQFPMLPFDLSTDMTSLNEDADRTAIMMSFTVAGNGLMSDEIVSRSMVHNRAQLAYSRVGPWLENTAAGNVDNDVFSLRSDSARAAQPQSEAQRAPALPDDWLVEQLKLQDEAAQALHKARVENGALEFHRAEADPVVADGRVVDVHEATHNRAMDLIEDLMVAANGVMARALRHGGRSGLQRVVRIPVRWDRIVSLAAEHGGELPPAPDSVALNNFLETQRKSDSIHYPDLAVAVIKLMGPGEYMLMRPNDDPTGHFGLAARDYTHSTAPNRRFPDLVTQRVLHAMINHAPPPYSDAELGAIAQHCNEADKALRKIERDMQKRVAAVALASRIGQTFAGVVTGASDKGVYVRVFSPPAEGRVMQGGDGLDVGDKVTVKLIHTDPARAFIDFAQVGRR
jgi:exoribonuclease R